MRDDERDIKNNEIDVYGDDKMAKKIMSPILSFVAGALFLVGVMYLLANVSTSQIIKIKDIFIGFFPIAIAIILLYIAIKSLSRRRR